MRATHLTLRRHPLALLRPRLARREFLPSGQLRELPNGQLVRACGLVTLRQQPETASGTVFVSLEDEDGAVQVIVWKRLRERQRRELLAARLLGVAGLWQREGEMCNLIAHRLVDLSAWLGRLGVVSRDFRQFRSTVWRAVPHHSMAARNLPVRASCGSPDACTPPRPNCRRP